MQEISDCSPVRGIEIVFGDGGHRGIEEEIIFLWYVVT
jgi:hypothetical protein